MKRQTVETHNLTLSLNTNIFRVFRDFLSSLYYPKVSLDLLDLVLARYGWGGGVVSRIGGGRGVRVRPGQGGEGLGGGDRVGADLYSLPDDGHLKCKALLISLKQFFRI